MQIGRYRERFLGRMENRERSRQRSSRRKVSRRLLSALGNVTGERGERFIGEIRSFNGEDTHNSVVLGLQPYFPFDIPTETFSESHTARLAIAESRLSAVLYSALALFIFKYVKIHVWNFH